MIVRNFLFHRVSDERDELWPPMAPVLFEKIIRILTQNYKVVCLEEWLLHPGSSGEKLATVLFDDGYKDNIEYAAPILKKYKCPASFYIVTDCINKNIPTWTYLLDYALQQTKLSYLTIDHDRAPENFKKIVFSDKETIRKIKPWMKKLSNVHRIEVLNSILDQCHDVPPPQNKMMNWEDIHQLMQAGFHIGSHSHTHPMLAALEDETEILDELNQSAKMIKENTGKQPVTISYPIGSFDKRVTRLAAQAGYTWGLAVKQRFYNTDKEDMFAIPRVELYNEPLWKCKLRISGVYSWVKNKMPS